jgi:hypothetical protein
MTWSGLFKILSGFLVAIGLLVGAGYMGIQYLITQFTAPPPRPSFPNDKPSPRPSAKNSSTPSVKPTVGQTPSPSPSASAQAASAQAALNYRAKITLEKGLNVRENPNLDSNRVGGVDYNDEVIVLEETVDKEWQRIRSEATGIEGWIKSGYIQPIDQNPSPSPENSPQ